MKKLTVEAKINKIQANIDELYKKLDESGAYVTPIQKKILKLSEELYVLKTQSVDNVQVCPVCKKEFICEIMDIMYGYGCQYAPRRPVAGM